MTLGVPPARIEEVAVLLDALALLVALLVALLELLDDELLEEELATEESCEEESAMGLWMGQGVVGLRGAPGTNVSVMT